MSTYEVSRELFGTATGLTGLRRAVEGIWTSSPPSYYSLALPAAREVLTRLDEVDALADELDEHAASIYTAAAPARALSAVLSDTLAAKVAVDELRGRLTSMLARGPSATRGVTLSPRYATSADIPTPIEGSLRVRVGDQVRDVATLTPRLIGRAPLDQPLVIDILVNVGGSVSAREEIVTSEGSTTMLARVDGQDVIAVDDVVLYMRARRTQVASRAGIVGDFESASRLVTATEVRDALDGHVVREHVYTGNLEVDQGVVALDEGLTLFVRGVGSYVVGSQGALSEYMTVTPASELTGSYPCVVTREYVRVRGDVEIVGEARETTLYTTDVVVESGDEVRVGGTVSPVSRGGFGADTLSPVESGAGEVTAGIYLGVQRAAGVPSFTFAWPARISTPADASRVAEGSDALRAWLIEVRRVLGEIAPAGQERARRAEAAELIERHARAGYDQAAYLLSIADIQGYRELTEEDAEFRRSIARGVREISASVAQ